MFHEFRQPLQRFLVVSGTNREDAVDIVQDTFLRLHQHLVSGGGRDNLRAWVFRVAHNLALNRRKSKAYSHSELPPGAVSPQDDPERLFFRKDRMRRLHRAIGELSATERACVILRAEGLRYREIADVLEIGTTTVADHLERALRKLGEKCNV